MVEKDRTNYNLRNARKQWLNKVRYKKIKLAKCEEKRTISCFSETRKDSSERWKKRRHMKERWQKWKSLSSFVEVIEKEKKERKQAIDGRDKETIK